MLTLALPPRKDRTAFNLERWNELLSDPILTKIEGRIETDRYGRIIMSPPPAPNHGSFQGEIAHLLRTLLPGGRVITECPISTADGVRAADVAWASSESMERLGRKTCFPKAPEICVEVLSPGNSSSEIDEKVNLYLDAGAKEIWLCAEDGAMTFLGTGSGRKPRTSRICPNFPQLIKLP